MGADTPIDPEVQKKLNEAAIAEAEAKIAKAKKDIAEAEKAAAEARDASLLEAARNKAIAEAAKAAAEAEKAAADAKDKGVREANRNKTIAEAEKATAEADKAAFMAQLPTSSSKPLEGKIELDDKAGYFADLLAYRTLKSAAADISTVVAGNLTGDKRVFLTTRTDWQQAGTQVADIKGRFKTFGVFYDELAKHTIQPDGTIIRQEVAPLAALAAAPAVLGVIADVAAFFRKDRTIKGRTMTLNLTALLAEVAQSLRDVMATPVLPSLNLDADTEIVREFTTLRGKDDGARLKRFDIERLITRLTAEISTLEAKLKAEQDKLAAIPKERTVERQNQEAEVKKAQEPLDKAKQKKENAEKVKGYFDSVMIPFAEFAARLSTIPDGGSVSPLAALSEASLMANQQNLLFISVVSQGGEFEARKSIWTNGKTYHRAGTVCTYILFRPSGEIASSGSIERDLHAKEGEVYYSYPPKPSKAKN